MIGSNGRKITLDGTVYDLAEYSVTVGDDGNGIASAASTSAVQKMEITLTAEPNNGSRFKEWQVN